MMHADDDCASTQEKQRLEESMRHQMKNCHRVRGGPECHGHVAQLGQGRVGNHALDIVLDDAEETHEQRRDRANHQHEGQRSV